MCLLSHPFPSSDLFTYRRSKEASLLKSRGSVLLRVKGKYGLPWLVQQGERSTAAPLCKQQGHLFIIPPLA